MSRGYSDNDSQHYEDSDSDIEYSRRVPVKDIISKTLKQHNREIPHQSTELETYQNIDIVNQQLLRRLVDKIEQLTESTIQCNQATALQRNQGHQQRGDSIKVVRM